jgi:transposase InsO family protein
MDLMLINGKVVLHVIDSATRFNAATFLDSHLESFGQSSDGIWDAFIDIWCSIYTGYPDRLRIDSGSAFTSVKWKTLIESRGITLSISGVKAHNSLGIGERYHGPLRRVYQKIEDEFPHVGPALLTQIAVKSINDTIGTNGLVPSLLVLDVVPRFPPMSIDLPKQRDRMAALAAAQMEMSAIVSENRIIAALNHNVPSSVDRTYEVGEEVLVFLEKDFFGRDRWWWYSWKTRL